MLAFLLTWWLGFVFTDTVDCRIHGRLYLMPTEVTAFDREDGCPVRSRLDHGTLLLSSKHWLVEFPIPTTQEGWTSFTYRWGSSAALIHGEQWPVSWSRVVVG